MGSQLPHIASSRVSRLQVQLDKQAKELCLNSNFMCNISNRYTISQLTMNYETGTYADALAQHLVLHRHLFVLLGLGLAILNAEAENSITVALRASPVSGAHTASYRVDKEAGDQAREQG